MARTINKTYRGNNTKPLAAIAKEIGVTADAMTTAFAAAKEAAEARMRPLWRTQTGKGWTIGLGKWFIRRNGANFQIVFVQYDYYKAGKWSRSRKTVGYATI